MRISRRVVRKPVVTLIGSLVVVAGVVMLLTPGPGLIGVAAGLAILATEYAWAERLLHRVRARIRRAADSFKRAKDTEGR